MKFCYVIFVLFFVIASSLAMEEKKQYIILTDGFRNWCIYKIKETNNSRTIEICDNLHKKQFFNAQKTNSSMKDNAVEPCQSVNYDHGLLLGNCLGTLFMSLRKLCNAQN